MFHSLRHGEGDINDSFSIGSPVPRRHPNTVEIDVERQPPVVSTPGTCVDDDNDNENEHENDNSRTENDEESEP